MNWYLSAIIAAIAFTGQFLGMKKLQSTYPILVYMTYIWLGSATILGILFVRPAKGLTLIHLFFLFLASIASWTGMYAYNLAMKQQSNIGYVEALSSIRVVVLYGISVLFFGALFEPVRILAVTGAVIGVILTTGFRSQTSQTSSKVWAFWAILSGLMFALLTTCVRIVTTNGLDSQTATAVILFISGWLYFMTSKASRTSLKPRGKLSILLFTIAISSIGNVMLFSSYSSAPNLAYPTAINNGRMILLYIVSLLDQSDKLESRRLIGIILTFICIALLG